MKNELPCYEVFPPEKSGDSCWVVVNTRNNIKRLYGCIYRSPNSSSENNNKLLDNIKWAKENFTEIILLADFNLPFVDWNSVTSNDTFSTHFFRFHRA